MSETTTVRDQAQLIVCPDGTQFRVYTDGTWDHECWDGSFVRGHEDASTTPDEVLAKLGL